MSIYPSITTTKKDLWPSKLEEVNKLKLANICIFPTLLNPEERQEFYQELDKSSVKNIPLVHLRDDSTTKELEYFFEKFNTRTFNIHTIHTEVKHPMKTDLSKFKQYIYVENHRVPYNNTELEKWSGICLDTAHLEDTRLKDKKVYEYYTNILGKYKIGCAHISAIKSKALPDPFHPEILLYDQHTYENLSEFDYLKKYKQYLPEIIAIELNNTIEEQLKVIEYLNQILS